MSHFTVMVVTETPDQVEAVLQPYHEFECTGIDDQYVIDVDKTEEFLKEYNEETRKMVVIDGEYLSPYDDKFKVPKDREHPLDRDYTYNTDGFIKEEIPFNKIYPTFEQFMIDWHSWEVNGKYTRIENDRVIDRTNPNKKWDWWQIGGRWSGFLKPKNKQIGVKGEPGLMNSEFDAEGVDQSIKSNIDFESRMQDAAKEAAEKYDKMQVSIAGRDWIGWDECREKFDSIKDAREFYHGQEVIKDMKKLDDSFYFDAEEYKVDRDKFINTKANAAISTFAVLKDGKWYERGDMGWWGCVSDEKDQSDWNAEFKDLIDTIPDDACITIVDCHI